MEGTECPFSRREIWGRGMPVRFSMSAWVRCFASRMSLIRSPISMDRDYKANCSACLSRKRRAVELKTKGQEQPLFLALCFACVVWWLAVSKIYL